MFVQKTTNIFDGCTENPNNQFKITVPDPWEETLMNAKAGADRRVVFCKVGEFPSIFSHLSDDLIHEYRRTPDIEHRCGQLKNYRVSGDAK